MPRQENDYGSINPVGLPGTGLTRQYGTPGTFGNYGTTRTNQSTGRTTTVRPVAKPKPKYTAPKASKPSKTPTVTATRQAPQVAPGPVAPIVPSLDQYLGGDTTYLDQIRQFDRTLGDFIANLGTRKTRLTADYGENKRNMGQTHDKDIEQIKNDFASRGLIDSGLFVDENAKYEKDYAQQLADFERQYGQSQQDLTTEDTQFRREQDLSKEAARADAARRRAEKYGL